MESTAAWPQPKSLRMIVSLNVRKSKKDGIEKKEA